MKRNIYLILFFILSSVVLNGQDSYSPVNFDYGRWVFTSFHKGPFWGTNYETDTLRYYFSGDTVISNHLYRKLHFIGRSYSQTQQGFEFKVVGGYAGALRDDTVNRTVWFGEEVAYDYNLSIGDTIKSGLYIGMIIDTIDSVFYCGKFFRRFIFRNTQNEPALIENVRALDVCIIPYEGPTGYCKLECYYETNSNNCSSCVTTLDINTIKSTDFNFYPNPTDGKIIINSPEGQKIITVYNSSGDLMLEKIEKSYQYTLDLSGNTAGIYMVRIITKNRVYIEKIIKK